MAQRQKQAPQCRQCVNHQRTEHELDLRQRVAQRRKHRGRRIHSEHDGKKIEAIGQGGCLNLALGHGRRGVEGGEQACRQQLRHADEDLAAFLLGADGFKHARGRLHLAPVVHQPCAQPCDETV